MVDMDQKIIKGRERENRHIKTLFNIFMALFYHV